MNRLGLAHVISHCHAAGTITATPRQWQVLHHLQNCRTERMGGALYRCDACDAQWLWHHSCRDRHCPQCQAKASQAWCEQQRQQLLPVPYFHLVFTLPHELNTWVTQDARTIYHLLFQACWQTLKVMGQRKLHGQLGMTAVLHTWGQQLTRHVHLHCLIPSGVLKPSRRWESRHKGYLLPVKALSKRFRGLMVSALRATRHSGGFATLSATEFDQTLNRLMTKPWCVYSKSAVRYRETLVEYLARYSHRIGLSNHRLLSWENGQVTLAYHDYRTTTHRRLRLTPEELLRRFLLHVLPKGFMRIRHYGFLVNAIKQRSLALIRRQLPQRNIRQRKTEQTPQNRHGPHCPHCGHHPVLCLGDQHTAPSQAIHRLVGMQKTDSS